MDAPARHTTKDDHVQIAAEASIIGSLVHDRSLLADLGGLGAEHFVLPGHREAWTMLVGDPSIDDELALQIAAPSLSEEAVERIGKSRHQRATVARARTILEESRARRALRNDLTKAMADLDAGVSSAADVLSSFMHASSEHVVLPSRSMSGGEAAEGLEKQEQSEAIPTGLRAFDYCTYGGLHVGSLTGAFARYKGGKTVLCASIARNLERACVPTLFFSLERREYDAERFLVARALGCDARDLDLKGEHRDEFDLYKKAQRYLRYIHKPGITIEEMRSHILAEIRTHGIKVVIVDYWQLIRSLSSRLSQQEKQQEAAQMLADLAATPGLDVAILVTGQLNQEGAPRGGEGILASAGIVVRINRPEDSEEGFIDTMVCNRGPARSSGGPQKPSIALTLPGPHFIDAGDVH